MNRFDGSVKAPTNEIKMQFVFFAGIGAVGTIVQYVTLAGLVEIAGIKPVLASAIGLVLGALVNYLLNYRFTFRSVKRHRETMPKFLAIALIGLLLNTLIMEIGTEMIRLHYLLAQVVATGLVLLWTFTGNRLWTFGEKNHVAGC